MAGVNILKYPLVGFGLKKMIEENLGVGPARYCSCSPRPRHAYVHMLITLHPITWRALTILSHIAPYYMASIDHLESHCTLLYAEQYLPGILPAKSYTAISSLCS